MCISQRGAVMSKKSSSSKKKDIAQLILAILVLIAIFGPINIINSSNKWNGTILNISIGLLAFVAIFYPLVIKRDIQKKREALLMTEWKERFPRVQNLLLSLEKESASNSNTLPNYDRMLNYCELP